MKVLCTRSSSRRLQRGAIFVEAIIVVSTFILLFLGMVFFRDMYLKSLRVSRMARATVIAYSMKGCPTDRDPAEWAGDDLDPKAGKSAPGPTQTPVPKPNQLAIPSKRAQRVMGELPGAGSNGSPMNPIADLGFSMEAHASTRKSKLGARKGFKRKMSSISFVSCGEGIKKDGFENVVNYALSKFNLKGDSEENDTP
jgi:hypothetical protein